MSPAELRGHQRAQAKSLRGNVKIQRERLATLKAGSRLYWDRIAILKCECAITEQLRSAQQLEAAARGAA